MRIDKFIWAVRLFKTRSLASKVCSSDKVKLNDEFCKPAKTVRKGDVISIKVNPIWRSYELIDLPKSRMAAALIPNFIKEITDENDLVQLKQFQEVQRQMRQQGFRGRPTKRDRRKLDDFGY